ncbi:hypothetical protein DB347_19950 [Opitutaceae bacterium EW11]|nr:hypothetical protein DB347_19950 [Opitutaceae bacterium EW11]
MAGRRQLANRVRTRRALSAVPVAASVSRPAARSVSARRLLLPAEHGSWALVFEPVALGLLVAPSAPGFALALAVAAGFFLRKPAKLGWGRLASKDPLVRRTARRAAVVFAALGSAFLLAAGLLGGLRVLAPFAAALPGAAYFAWCDRTGRVRSLASEFVGAATCSLPLVAIALAGWWKLPSALALGAVGLARSLPTIAVVRAVLRREERGSVSLAVALQILAISLVGALAFFSLVPSGAAFVTGALAMRAALYLSFSKRAPSAKTFGILETIVGLAWIVFLARIFA